MNKKIFGIRLGTIISWCVCLAVAFLIWLYANMDKSALDGAVSLITRG